MEIFKSIPGYSLSYEISNIGRVRSLKYGKKKIIKSRKCKQGYLRVNLSKDGNQKTHNIHQLLGMAFLDHTPCKYKFIVDHKNNIKTDNRVENLQVITQRENASKDRIGFTSKFIGVYWNKRINKWQSCITIKGKNIHLGTFKNELEASAEYQKALKNLEL